MSTDTMSAACTAPECKIGKQLFLSLKYILLEFKNLLASATFTATEPPNTKLKSVCKSLVQALRLVPQLAQTGRAEREGLTEELDDELGGVLPEHREPIHHSQSVTFLFGLLLKFSKSSR